MDLGLKDQVALITAASKGLGRAAAFALAREGANLALCARSDQLDRTADEIREATTTEVLAVRTDLTQPDQIDSLIEQTLEHYERLDVLIINAGGPPPGSFMDLDATDWQDSLQLTLMSAVHLLYGCLPTMLEQGSGSIVTTQSYSVKQPIDNLVLSNSIRMAVIGLVKSLANEVGPRGIRVNSINPAWTWTERVQQLMEDRAQRSGRTVEEEAALVAEVVPLGRMGTIEEFGHTIAWLASPAASFIHGHALMFDGGAVKAAL
jgi:3-oxoacyl-[acyl-carrier protein] reductase